MAKSNAFETDLLALIFNAAAIADLAENDTTSPATNLYLSLHTGDPGEGGDQTTSEAAYTSYARVAVARTSGGWTVSGNEAALVADAVFPAATGGSETNTHLGVGVAASGAGKLLYSGALDASIVVVTGVVPRIDAGTKVTED